MVVPWISAAASNVSVLRLAIACADNLGLSLELRTVGLPHLAFAFFSERNVLFFFLAGGVSNTGWGSPLTICVSSDTSSICRKCKVIL